MFPKGFFGKKYFKGTYFSPIIDLIHDVIEGVGNLISEAAEVSGIVKRIIIGIGNVISEPATVYVIVKRVVQGIGSLASQITQIDSEGLVHRFIEGIGNLISGSTGIEGYDGAIIEIKRMFAVSLSLSQSFKANIARKLKFKVNK